VTTLTCSKCGQPMPELDADLATLARAAGGVTLAHDICPGTRPPNPDGRYFEVRVQVVEVTENPEGDADALGGPDPVSVTKFFEFDRGVRAADLDSAMRPLAHALGERWGEAEKVARIADEDGGW
jgi:hypothetical protein